MQPVRFEIVTVALPEEMRLTGKLTESTEVVKKSTSFVISGVELTPAWYWRTFTALPNTATFNLAEGPEAYVYKFEGNAKLREPFIPISVEVYPSPLSYEEEYKYSPTFTA